MILSESELISHGTRYRQNTEQFNFTLMKMSQDKKGVLADQKIETPGVTAVFPLSSAS